MTLALLRDSEPLDTVLQDVIGTIASTLGWQVAMLWQQNGAASHLECRAWWDDGSDEYADLRASSRMLRVEYSFGRLGEVWSTGEPRWVADVTADGGFARAEMIDAAGLRSAVLLPLCGTSRSPIGVLEFFRAAPSDPQPALEQMLETFTAQLCIVLEKEAATEPVRRASAEYRRALRDYTQLVRHRLANPLTAITAGVQTLLHLDTELDPATRQQILEAMAETAHRLENAILHPEIHSSEERDLSPVPELTGGDVQQLVQVDAVQAEEHFREINDVLAEQGDPAHAQLEFFCECWSLDCRAQISLDLDTYFTSHRDELTFIVCPDHVMPEIETVEERHERYWLVRKRDEVMERAHQD